MTTAQKIINFVVFQSVWLIAVIGAANGLVWPALLALAVALIIHAFNAPFPARDYQLACLATLIGLAADTLLIQTGLLTFSAALPFPGLTPVWELVLWANLALAINHCLGWLHGRRLLQFIGGAIGGPLAYAGGAMLGAAEVGVSQGLFLATVAVIWGLVTPLLFWLTEHARNDSGGPAAL